MSSWIVVELKDEKKRKEYEKFHGDFFFSYNKLSSSTWKYVLCINILDINSHPIIILMIILIMCKYRKRKTHRELDWTIQ